MKSGVSNSIIAWSFAPRGKTIFILLYNYEGVGKSLPSLLFLVVIKLLMAIISRILYVMSRSCPFSRTLSVLGCVMSIDTYH